MCGNVHTDVSRLEEYVCLFTVFILSLARTRQLYSTESLHQRRQTADSFRAQISDERYALYVHVIICNMNVCLYVYVYTYISLSMYARCIDTIDLYFQSPYVLLT
jgi:hypothetical protein